jgi:hypothetical protein
MALSYNELEHFDVAKERAARFLPPGALEWLTDARPYFKFLAQ